MAMRELLFPKICFAGFQYFIFHGSMYNMVANTTGLYWANHMRGHWKLLEWPCRCWSLIWKLCVCLHRAQIALWQANAYLAWFSPRSRLWQQQGPRSGFSSGGVTRTRKREPTRGVRKIWNIILLKWLEMHPKNANIKLIFNCFRWKTKKKTYYNLIC